TVPADNAILEKRQRPPRLERVHPQRHFAELDGHLIDVHAIDAPPDDVPQSSAYGLRRGLFVTGSHGGQPPGEAMRSSDKEVSATARGVADREAENFRFGVRSAPGLLEQGVEGRVEQTLDQAGRRVVAARRLAFVTARRAQVKRCSLDLDFRM